MNTLRFLLTNDDGVDAAGLSALRSAAQAITTAPTLTVAPDRCHSGCGHRVTTHDPIRVSRQSDHVFTTDGTPADCVRVALDHVAPDVDWVLAGINHGGNLGAHVFMSGTVAAVREGVLHGKPGIAASYYHKKGLDPLNWERATRWLTPILRDLTSRPWLPGSLWNINLPHLMNDSAEPAIEFCDLDPSPLPVRYRTEDGALHYAGNYHERQRHPGSDVDRCFAGRITISLVKLY